MVGLESDLHADLAHNGNLARTSASWAVNFEKIGVELPSDRSNCGVDLPVKILKKIHRWGLSCRKTMGTNQNKYMIREIMGYDF